MTTSNTIPGFERTPCTVGPCSDGHAYFAVADDGSAGWTNSKAKAYEHGTAMIVQRVMSGRRKGSEWTIKGGWG